MAKKNIINPEKKFNWKIPLVFVLIIAIAFIGWFFFFSPPPSSAENDEKTVDLSEKNTEIYALLVAGGIINALVDATKERVIIEYDLPNEIDKKISWYYVLGAVSNVFPESEKVIIQAFVEDKPTEEVTIQMKDLLEFKEGKISEQEFEERFSINNSIS